jgi:signal transduction histidine kinase
MKTPRRVSKRPTASKPHTTGVSSAHLNEEIATLTRERDEALEQQRATSEVLKVINGSTTDLQAVLDTLVEAAAQLCDADKAVIYKLDGGFCRLAATYNFSQEFIDFTKQNPIGPGRGTIAGRVVLEGKTIHIPDVLADADYTAANYQSRGVYRSNLGVPLLREGETLGVFTLTRSAVRPYTEKQIELATTFADQAVIAIENARLFDEARSRTTDLARSVEELRALGDVSQAVNSTIDLQTVLSTIIAKAAQLSGTEAGTIYVFDETDQEFQVQACYGMDEALIASIKDRRIRLGEMMISQSVLRRVPMQLADVTQDASSLVIDVIQRAGFRAVLTVPLLASDRIVGALVVRRKAPGEFSETVVNLLQTFAAQSVLAIQNARLFTEIADKSRQLEEASKHKSQFLANMSHELRTPLNAILGYTELIVDGVYGDTPEKVQTALKRITTNGKHLLGLINDVLDLSKIEAGQLTLSLDNYWMKDVVHGVCGAVEPLAANKKIAFKAEVASDLPRGRGDERRLTQVLLNLVGNAIKFTDAGEVAVRASAANGHFSVSVSDTGPGISAADQSKLFQEFQQADNSITKKKGGTGLGLAISKRIIEMHGGRIGLESQVGKGSIFLITLPILVEPHVAVA